jgi:hypothetical protein
MKKKDVHIVPHPEGWAVKREGAKRASSVHETKAPATEAGRKTAKAEKVELVIHDKHSKIIDSDSYGNDPNPPKDKKH